MYKIQKCVWAAVKQRLEEVPVPFIHYVEMGGWWNDSVWPCIETLPNSVEFNRPCQQSGLGSWWSAFWTSWAEPPGPYTCPSSPPGPWPPPPLPYFSGKHTRAHSGVACLRDGAVVLWETLKKIWLDKMESEQHFLVLEDRTQMWHRRREEEEGRQKGWVLTPGRLSCCEAGRHALGSITSPQLLAQPLKNECCPHGLTSYI